MGTRLRRFAAVASLTILSSSCAGPATVPPRPEPGTELAWRSAEQNGMGDGVDFALTLSSPVMGQDRVGFVGLIDDDGTSRFLETGPHGDGQIDFADGRLCATSETTTYELTATSAEKWDRGGYPGAGLWTAAGLSLGSLTRVDQIPAPGP